MTDTRCPICGVLYDHNTMDAHLQNIHGLIGLVRDPTYLIGESGSCCLGASEDVET